MKDRVPLYPGRVKMTPVAGQENVYDMVRSDQPTQDGDPLNKATLLKDATAALFGLGADSVPDDVLAWIGKYNLHWWRRRTPAISGYVEKKEKVSKMYGIVGVSKTVNYAKSIKVDQDSGSISLVSPTELKCAYGNPSAFMQELCSKSPLYFTEKGDNDYETLYYIPSGSTFYDKAWTDAAYTLVGYYNSNNNSMKVNIASLAPTDKRASLVTSVFNDGEPGEWEYIQSSDRSEYPDSGEQDGYEYQYIGIPFENAASPHVKIVTGSYVGTGKYGENNPNSLTFEFNPKLLFITNRQGSGNFYGISDIDGNPLDCSMLTTSYTKGLGFGSKDSSDILSSYGKKSGDGKTITWYHSRSASSQQNDANYTYYYFAIG